MAERLESLLQALKHAPTDRALDQLAPAVWRRLEPAREARRGGGPAFAMSAAAVVVSLFLGVATGGLAAASGDTARDEISVFSVGPQLAPSTLLEGRG